MLEGITVLSQEPIMKPVNWLIVLIIIAIFVMVVGLIMIFHDAELGMTIAIIGVIFVYAFSLMKEVELVPTGRYKYKVILEESEQLDEIYDKYEVIEIEGKIYTIQDKGE